VHNQVLLLSRDRDAVVPYRSGVSLHGHTRHSQESLGFIGKLLERNRLTRQWIEGKKEDCRRITGVTLAFEDAYWTPPLCERLAFDVETRQIEELGLKPMVSLTDHNSIDACTLLRADDSLRETPISTEWTVPFGSAVFHVGVHNLPPAEAESFMAAMHETTASADEEQTFALFAELCGIPEVLLVFNHPLWNFMGITGEQFDFELTRFLESTNRYLHGFELNGMRDHSENRGVIELAAEWGQVMISGGDRHGCEPNAWLNLSNAADFPEFVDEIRNGRESTVLIMPQYARPLCWRFYQNFTHVVADYPGHPEGRRRWDERTFHPDGSGRVVPMARLWKNGTTPEFLQTIFAAAVLASRVPLGGVLRGWRDRENESLLMPATASGTRSGPNRTIREAFGEGGAEASLEDCLYARGEPATD
jgi:hypothetical protein